jgi:cell division protein FtsL
MMRWINLGLAVAVFMTAIAIVLARHEDRKLFIELQALGKQRDAMNEEWGRLQLEQATWATQGRIEDLARDKLQMVVPTREEVVLVRNK